jgi:hypothetical protein
MRHLLRRSASRLTDGDVVKLPFQTLESGNSAGACHEKAELNVLDSAVPTITMLDAANPQLSARLSACFLRIKTPWRARKIGFSCAGLSFDAKILLRRSA